MRLRTELPGPTGILSPIPSVLNIFTGSHNEAETHGTRRLVTCLLLLAGWRSWFERVLPEGFLDVPRRGVGSDAVIDA